MKAVLHESQESMGMLFELTAKVREPAHHLGDLFPCDSLELVGWHGVIDGLYSVDYQERRRNASDGVKQK
jgi:hypothetical protein